MICGLFVGQNIERGMTVGVMAINILTDPYMKQVLILIFGRGEENRDFGKKKLKLLLRAAGFLNV